MVLLFSKICVLIALLSTRAPFMENDKLNLSFQVNVFKGERNLHLVGTFYVLGFPGGSEVKVSAWNTGGPGLIPGSGRFPWRRKMATHSSTLAWRIPWREDPGRLQSIRAQRVRHDLATTLSLSHSVC